jgi:hypothetical protein
MTSLALLASKPSDRASKEFWESTIKLDRCAKYKAKAILGFKSRKIITQANHK